MNGVGLQFRVLGLLVIGTLSSLIACSGGGGGATSTSTPAGQVAVSLNLEATVVNAQDTVAASATVTGTSDTSLTWTVDGIANGNATVGTLTGSGALVTYVAPATPGTHTLLATSSSNTSAQASKVITITSPPMTVTVAPATSGVAPSGTLSLTATVTHSSHTGVKWSVDGIAGGNASTGLISGSGNTVTYTAPAAAGGHAITAASVANPEVSGAAAVTVQAPADVQVTVNPTTSTLASAGSVALTATVTGTSNTAVAWTVDGVSGGNAAVGTLSGTGSTVTYTAPAAAGTHAVTATSAADATASASSVITVQAPVLVALSPATANVSSSGTLAFTATVTGTSNTAVTWTVDGVANGNATTGTLSGTGTTVNYTAPAASGTHTVTATSAAHPAASASSAVTVQPGVQVTLAPGATTLATGGTLAFTASVTGSGTTSVAWTVDGVASGNATTGTLTGTGTTVTYTAPSASGTHTITATSTAQASASASTLVTVQAPPPVTVNLGAATLATSGTTTVTAVVGGSASVTLAWFVDGVANGSTTVGTIVGAGGATATYTAPAVPGTHTVSATATTAAKITGSGSAVVNVQAMVTVAVAPTSSSLNTGSTLAFTATVAGTSNTGVTWSVDGVTGGTTASGTVTGTGNTVTYNAPATAGTHTLKATSAASGSASGTATVTVLAAALPSVTVTPSATSATVSTTVTVTAAVSGTSNTAVTWTVDGIANGSAAVGTLTGTGATVTYTAPATAGAHTITATSAADTSVSDSALITVLGPLTIGVTTVPSGTLNINASGTLWFRATLTGTTNTGLVWAVDGIPNGNATVGTLTATGTTAAYVAPTVTGTHTVTATSTADGRAISTSTLDVLSSCAPAPTSSTVVSVKDAPYNAKGDGVTDDTAAIQAAVKAVTGTGGTVSVPAGTYLINPTLNNNAGIRLGSNMTFSMAAGATLQAASTSTSTYVVLLASGVQNVNIIGGTLLGNVGNNTITDTNESGFGVEVVNASDVVVQGVTANQFWADGFYVGTSAKRVTLCNVVASANRRNGMSVTSVDGMVVRGSTFENSTGSIESGAWANGSGVDLEPNKGDTINDVQLLGCTFSTNQAIGICIGPSIANTGSAFVQNIIIDGGTANGNGIRSGGAGIDVSNCSGNQVSNNTVNGDSGDGIYVHSGANGNLIMGNSVSGTVPDPGGDLGNGIMLYQVQGNTITGNTVTGCAGAGLRDAYPTGTNTWTSNTSTNCHPDTSL